MHNPGRLNLRVGYFLAAEGAVALHVGTASFGRQQAHVDRLQLYDWDVGS